jgi:hypothetical protein
MTSMKVELWGSRYRTGRYWAGLTLALPPSSCECFLMVETRCPAGAPDLLGLRLQYSASEGAHSLVFIHHQHPDQTGPPSRLGQARLLSIDDKIPEVHPAIHQAHRIRHRQPCIAVDSLGHHVARLGQDFTEEGVELGLRVDNEQGGLRGRSPAQPAVRQTRHVCRWLPFIAVRGLDRDVACLGQDGVEEGVEGDLRLGDE